MKAFCKNTDPRTTLLREELSRPCQGPHCYNVYMGMGYEEALGLSPTESRATAFASLLRHAEKCVYRNDRIVGSLRGLYQKADMSDEDAAYYTSFCYPYPERGWLQGRDHYASGFERILRIGIPGIYAEIEASQKKHAGDRKKQEFLSSCRIAMDGFCDMIRGYRDAAGAAEDGEAIRESLDAILTAPPRTFRQGLQLVWLIYVTYCYQSLYAQALGRLDQYLYPLYRQDIENGTLTEEEAVVLLENTFIKYAERPVFTGSDEVSNICIAGVTPQGEDAVNGLSYCVLHAVGNCMIPGPNLSARISEKTPDAFLKDCLRVIGTGLGYPALMNDGVNVAALERMGYEKTDCRNFAMVGCIENFLPGQQPPWSDGRFDVPRTLEHTLNMGKGTLSGKRESMNAGDPRLCKDMDDFMLMFEKQLKFEVGRYIVGMYNENGRFNNEFYTNPFMSCMADDCIERGLDLCDGGTKYRSAHGAGTMGVGTTADSLAAIEKCVFLDRSISMDRLIEALHADFEGYEEEHRLLLEAPKYGNNDPFVDKYAIWFVDFISGLFDAYRTPDGGRYYIGMAANTANIAAGAECGATPDGRKAHAPLSDAASPTYGMDKKGPTCTVASLIKPDYSHVALGTVVNQKFSPHVFEEDKLDRLVALLRVYFGGGGQEMQVNSVSRDVLQDAMEHPELYDSLVVRVSGFSAYYTRLPDSVQKDILSRTEHTETK